MRVASAAACRVNRRVIVNIMVFVVMDVPRLTMFVALFVVVGMWMARVTVWMLRSIRAVIV